jgi:molybdopterin/thiamine biosynthesis adenylyltransferase
MPPTAETFCSVRIGEFLVVANSTSTSIRWSYEEAFSRNAGLISPEEQTRLRQARVAIAGMGGIGGIDLVTLARLGVGRFTIADHDAFDVANTNRQYGASLSTMGRSKVEVMANIARDINPEVDLRVFRDPIGPHNMKEFLHGADLLVDAIEFFEIDVRRFLFRAAADQGIFSVTAGPVGFSGIWIIFDPHGMSFEEYFEFSDGMDHTEKVAAFGLGLAPKATQKTYMNLESLDLKNRNGPSSSLACHIAAGAMACEALKILLKKGRVWPAPYYHQFDAYHGRFVRSRLMWFDRLIQRRKRRRLVEAFRRPTMP